MAKPTTPSGQQTPHRTPHRTRLQQRLQRDRLLISVDFGTTYTSVAYLHIPADAPPLPPSLHKIETFHAFPGGPNSYEMPSILMYDARIPGRPAMVGWEVTNATRKGRVPPGCTVVRLPKLLLHESIETADERRELDRLARHIESQTGVRPDFVRDFLRELWKWVVERVGTFNSPHWKLEDCEVEWVMCVPAAWSEEEHRRVVEAAEDVGIMAPSLVSEPEAAALVMVLEKGDFFKKGDTFIVCDAGGGTVDLITFEMIRTDPLQLKETAVGEGVLCGSSYLDKNFKALITSKLERGGRYSAQVSPAEIEKATREFNEDIKEGFLGPEDRYDSVGIKGLLPCEELDFLEGEELRVSKRETAERVFDPIINQIRSMLKQQIRESREGVKEDSRMHNKGAAPSRVKYIILTGGLGHNDYVHRELMRTFDWDAEPEDKISVQMPALQKGSVARGGVLLGLTGEDVIVERRSKYSYGFATIVEWDPKDPVHASWEPLVDEIEGSKIVHEVQWLCFRGQPVEQGQEFHTSLRERRVLTDEAHKPVPDALIISKDTRPRVIVEQTYKGKYKAEEEFEIETDLSSILPLFPIQHNKTTEKSYYNLTYHNYMRLTNLSTATFEVVTRLPDKNGVKGGIHRAHYSRPFPCDSGLKNKASLKDRKKEAPLEPIHFSIPKPKPEARKRQTSNSAGVRMKFVKPNPKTQQQANPKTPTTSHRVGASRKATGKRNRIETEALTKIARLSSSLVEGARNTELSPDPLVEDSRRKRREIRLPARLRDDGVDARSFGRRDSEAPKRREEQEDEEFLNRLIYDLPDSSPVGL